MRTLLALAISAALVLDYGYNHAATHGWLHVNLIDRSVKPLTYFSVSFSVDGANCKAKTEPGTQAH
jgi:hypothetical protein